MIALRYFKRSAMLKQIYPDYIKDYVCKCGDCRNTCCQNWTIFLTKNEFDAAYGRSLPQDYSALVNRYLEINKNQDGRSLGYARINFLENGFCGFLDKDGRCRWQKIRGPENACTVCREYPRTYCQCLSNLYVSASCSCEAINELLMDHRDKLTLLTGSETEQEYMRCRFDEKFCTKRPATAYYPEFLRLGMNVLQDRSYRLGERMVILSYAMRSLDFIEKTHCEKKIPEYIEKFLSDMDYNQMLSKAKAISIPPQSHLAFLSNILAQFNVFKPFSDLVARILKGLRIQVEESEHAGRMSRQICLTDGDIFLQRKKSFLTPSFAHFFENYLVNEFISMVVPFSNPCQDIWNNWFSFAFDWILMNFALAGLFPEIPQNTELIDAVTMLTRMLTHSERVRWELFCQVKAKCGADFESLIAFLQA